MLKDIIYKCFLLINTLSEHHVKAKTQLKQNQLALPLANDWGFTSGFLVGVRSLRHIILETEDIVENAAGITFDKIAPTKDLLLSSESL